jgi:6-phosphofructokinase
LGAKAVELLQQDIGGVAVGVRGMEIIATPFADVQKGLHAADTGIAELVDVMAVMTRA